MAISSSSQKQSIDLSLSPRVIFGGGKKESTGEPAKAIELASADVEKNWGWPTLAEYERATGKKISSFGEAPALKDLVAAGKLPPIEQRLPDEPMVDEPFEMVGKYGGTLRLGMVSGTTYYPATVYFVDYVLGLDRVGKEIVPNIAKKFEFSQDKKTLTLFLRKGMKWSDGEAFDAGDFMFWYDSLLLNDELQPVKASWLRPGGKLVEVDKIDDYAVRFEFAVPYEAFKYRIGSAGFNGGQGIGLGGIFSPEHYMKQFHIDFNPKANELAKKEGYENWTQLFKARDRVDIVRQAVGTPTTQPWVIKSVLPEGVVYERNPYYYKIDTAGNQLPYIDTVKATHFTDHEAMILATVTGKYDYMDWGTKFEDVPVLKENEGKGNYVTFMTKDLWGSHSHYLFNQIYEEDPALGELFRNKKFRQALSIAINREEVNNIVTSGMGRAHQATVNPDVSFFKESWEQDWAQYDPDTANTMLDEIGLDKRDGDGFRLRPDGQALSITVDHPLASGSRMSIDEMVRDYWNKVGVRTQVKPMDRSYMAERYNAGANQVASWIMAGTSETYLLAKGSPGGFFSSGVMWGKAYRNWWNTREKAEPTGTEPPAEVKRLFDLADQVPFLVGDEKIKALQEAFDIWAENTWGIGVIGLIPKPGAVHKNIGNVNMDTVCDVGDVGCGWYNRQYQFYWK